MIFFKNNGQLQGISFLDNYDFLKSGQPATHTPPSRVLEEDKEYIYPGFRALSKGCARKRTSNGMIVLDFSEGTILHDATDLYPGIGIYPNHLHDIERWKGSVLSAYWSEDTTEDFPVPGVNVKARIWKGVDPLGHVICADDYKTAKGIKDGIITRVSTGVLHAYRQSHPMPAHEFFRTMGTIIDGAEVRMIIEAILGIIELSLVLFGADEYAKRLSATLAQQHIRQKDILASVTDNTIETYTDTTPLQRRFWKTKRSTFLASMAAPRKTPSPTMTHKDMDSLDTALTHMRDEHERLKDTITQLQTDANTTLTQQLKEQQTTITALEQKVTSLSQENTALSEELDTTQRSLSHLEQLADSGRTYHRVLRENAIRAFQLLCDSQAVNTTHEECAQTILLIKTAPIDMVERMCATFTSKALTSIPRNRVSARVDPAQQPKFFEMSLGYRRHFARRLLKRQSQTKQS